MGVLQRFEKRLGGLVEGSFAKVFRGRVEPVELAGALAREADVNKAVGPHRVLVPNVYEIHLGKGDHDRLAPYALTLCDELATLQHEHADQQGYTFVGPVLVTLQRSEQLGTGAFRIISSVEAGDEQPAARAGGTWEPPPKYRSPAAAPPFPDPAVTPGPVAARDPRPARDPAPAPAAFSQQTTAIPRVSPTPRNYGSLLLPDGERVPVQPGTVVLGRGAEADVRLADPSVSRRHAELRVEGEQVHLVDLGSTNGTTVNGRRVDRARLSDGDRVALGSALFTYRG